ncbi:MAG: alpha-galactosidase [Erysipelotrichaceae bacterium]|nr:alpha-galactosidase [Erysipelotrichaceae bacterium]
MKISVNYLFENFNRTIGGECDSSKTFETDEALLSVEISDERIKVEFTPKKNVLIINTKAILKQEYQETDRLFFNGYQDWSFSYEDTIKTRNAGINKMPFKSYTVNKLHLDRYGDGHFVEYDDKEGVNHGWSYFYIRNQKNYKLFGSLNEDFAFTRFKVNTKENILSIIPDIEKYEADKKFTVLDVCVLNGLEDEVFDKWFEMMGIKKPNCEPIIGYTSWYNHYQDINEDIIVKDFKGIDALPQKIDVFQIDDGYETYVGDWLNTDKNKFPNGLKPTVEAIHAKGFKAGLWLAPFCAEEKSEVYKNHRDWFVKDKDGSPLKCGCNWSGYYALDIYNKEVVKYLEKVFDIILNDYGFDLVKLDFLYSACVYARKDKPRGQIMADGMKLLRRLCGDKQILGCGVPLASCFGRVEYCRVGCDVSLSYDDVFYMHFLHPERNSTKRTMIDSIARRHLDGRAFYNDPDVFILRDKNVKLSAAEKEKLATVNGLFGSVLFMSDDASLYDDKKMNLYKKILKLRGRVRDVELIGNKLTVKYEYENNLEELSIEL